MEAIFISIFLVIMTIAIVAAVFFSKKAIIKRNLKKIQHKSIPSCRTNEMVKVIGKVEIMGEPLIAPLSQRPCAYYYVLVEKQRSNGKSTSWVKAVEEEVCGKFLIKDANGHAIIDNSNISTYLVQDKKFSSGFRKDADPILESYLQMHGETSVGYFGFNKTMRYKEGVLEEGELVAAAGKCWWKDVDNATIPSGKVLVISANGEKQPVYLTDDPGLIGVGDQ